LDVVGLFSSNVARFDINTTADGLSVQGSHLVIAAELDFPSAIQDLSDGTMLVTNLGNDNPATGELRPGSIGRFDIATGDFLGTFVAGGGDGNLLQPTSLLLLSEPLDLDCNGDGVFNSEDLSCACAAGVRDQLLVELGLLAGDIDANGEVAFEDFLILAAGFGQPGDYSSGDLDCSGTVDFADFLTLSANFGQSSNVAAVPEPNASVAMLFGVLGLLAWRRG
jgi:hypothetical protein